MKIDLDSTIVAHCTGNVPARRAIVRISGRQTIEILKSLMVAPSDCEWLTRITHAEYRSVRVCLDWPGRTLAVGLYCWPDNRCYTGEPSAEFHLIGSIPVVESLVRKVIASGARHADRGEFTLRSFLAGKLDLVQAEAVLGVIESETEEELHIALEQLAGNLSRPVRQMRHDLIELIANLEAGLDFVEEDIEFISSETMHAQLAAVLEKMDKMLDHLQTRDARSQQPIVALVGLPNAGKSSLFNALVGQDRAIVSEQAGTTRDFVAETLHLPEFSVELVDTAGYESIHGDSPRAAAQLALMRCLMRADIVLLCEDGSNEQLATPTYESLLGMTHRATVLPVRTKYDLKQDKAVASNEEAICVSVVSGMGLDELVRRLGEALEHRQKNLQSETMHRTALRCRQSLLNARQSIVHALGLIDQANQEDLVAAELRIALEELSAIIGEVHSEDILGNIFSRFCIGK